MAVLELNDCVIRFGGLVAVKDLNLFVKKSELFGLIGPNGAGKTTIFNLITGVYPPTSGAILLEGNRIDGKAPHVIASRGIARTFQNIRLFDTMTVLENVKVSSHMSKRQNIWSAVVRSPAFHEEEEEIEAFAYRLLSLFQLEGCAHDLSMNLPYGHQRRLEIARALATRPKLLLLDEPAAGMNPQEAVALMALIRRLRDEFDLSILLVEHNMKVVMGVCERIQVIEYGQTITVGTPEEVRTHPGVIEAYLGKE